MNSEKRHTTPSDWAMPRVDGHTCTCCSQSHDWNPGGATQSPNRHPKGPVRHGSGEQQNQQNLEPLPGNCPLDPAYRARFQELLPFCLSSPLGLSTWCIIWVVFHQLHFLYNEQLNDSVHLWLSKISWLTALSIKYPLWYLLCLPFFG